MKKCIFAFFAIFSTAIFSSASEEIIFRKLASCPLKSIADASGKYCCPEKCGQCGGKGCNTRPGGASSCCTSQITVSCEFKGAPCVAQSTSTSSCPIGGLPDASGKYCCPKACGQCGGSGCHTRPGGSGSCCTSQITASCNGGKLPCISSSSQTTSKPTSPVPSGSCPPGGIPDASNKACCSASCGQCGGSGCDKRTGGAAACCTSQISKSCIGGLLPCLISSDSPPSTSACPLGGIANDSGVACCPASCGQCGGSGCDKRPGGALNCCTSKISSSCSTGKLPCLVGNGLPETVNYCKDGILATLSKKLERDDNYWTTVCCPKSCSACDTSDNCALPEECCANKIADTMTDIDVSCRNHGPPCIVPDDPDLCTPNPCQNGSRCGMRYTYNQYTYNQYCECSELEGNYTSRYCQTLCKDNETPCEYNKLEFPWGDEDLDTNVCCSNSDSECVQVSVGSEFFCLPIDRVDSCTPNICENGARCFTTYSEGGNYFYFCDCPKGFGGAVCNIPL